MSENKTVNLPYFDAILKDFQAGNTEVIKSFGYHVHWGYWENSDDSDGSVEDFAQAAEKLAQKVYSAGKVTDNTRVLDCGCGFGGTIASINERFTNMQLAGLNIDSRQLARARVQVQPCTQNHIEFVEGNACELPFQDNSFDAVLAVECIFHFPSRQRFFQETKVPPIEPKSNPCNFSDQYCMFQQQNHHSSLQARFLSNPKLRNQLHNLHKILPHYQEI